MIHQESNGDRFYFQTDNSTIWIDELPKLSANQTYIAKTYGEADNPSAFEILCNESDFDTLKKEIETKSDNYLKFRFASKGFAIGYIGKKSTNGKGTITTFDTLLKPLATPKPAITTKQLPY